MLSIKGFCCKASDLKVLLSRQVHKSYYDSLGLTPKASKGDIKRAYYEKSMVFHPDKGEGTAEKFKEISTAYEVLGNNKLRKMYDKGLLPVGAAGYAEAKEKSKSQPDEPEVKKAQDRRKPPSYYDDINASFSESNRNKKTYTGKTPQYDFDAWTEAHYAGTFSRQAAEKVQYEQNRKNKEQATRFAATQKQDRVFSIVIVVVWLSFMLYFRDIYQLQYDKTTKRRPPES